MCIYIHIFMCLQKRNFFRIKNKERGHFMSIQGGVEELKSGRVVVTSEVEPMSDIWFYQDGLIKNKVTYEWKVISIFQTLTWTKFITSSELVWSCVSSVVVPKHVCSGDG